MLHPRDLKPPLQLKNTIRRTPEGLTIIIKDDESKGVVVLYLTMTVRLVLDDATRGAFPTTRGRRVDMVSDFVDGDISNDPLTGA